MMDTIRQITDNLKITKRPDKKEAADLSPRAMAVRCWESHGVIVPPGHTPDIQWDWDYGLNPHVTTDSRQVRDDSTLIALSYSPAGKQGEMMQATRLVRFDGGETAEVSIRIQEGAEPTLQILHDRGEETISSIQLPIDNLDLFGTLKQQLLAKDPRFAQLFPESGTLDIKRTLATLSNPKTIPDNPLGIVATSV